MKRKQKLADKLPAWTDNDHPDAYLTKFQAIMSKAEILQGEWSSQLLFFLERHYQLIIGM